MTSICKQRATFGTNRSSVKYRPRPAAYVLVFNENGRVATVRGRRGYFLPGGGSNPGETPEETVAREVDEELARGVSIGRKLGEAIQYFSIDGTYYEMTATFFRAELTDYHRGKPEHELHWLDPDEMEGKFFHACHEWAVKLGRL